MEPLFEKSHINLATGDKVRFNKTVKETGQVANHVYSVDSVRSDGKITLKDDKGNSKTINPNASTNAQHIDYAYAVTGYGAQGASSPYVIALEGGVGSRKQLANQRSFYISLSRAKQHVQIYTDNKDKWLAKIGQKDIKPLTVHDALKPESQRKQAQLIWKSGIALTKAGLGKKLVREGKESERTTARLIPQTKKDSARIAYPVYDHNGKAAGLIMQSVDKAQKTTLLTTANAQGAIMQQSQNGQTLLAKNIEQARTLSRENPQHGVVMMINNVAPSPHLLKHSKGELPDTALKTQQHIEQVKNQAQQQVISATNKAAVAPTIPKEYQRDTRQASLQLARENHAQQAKTRQMAQDVKEQQSVSMPKQPEQSRSSRSIDRDEKQLQR